jgi:hypothetical protein
MSNDPAAWLETRHVSVRIDRTAREVYDFARDPRQMPSWAAGLASSTVEQLGGAWFVVSPMGRVQVAFTPENLAFVLDHDVTLPGGQVVTNPLRVLADGDACDVVFTVRHRSGVSSTDFERDIAAVTTDLGTLKRLLEERAC